MTVRRRTLVSLTADCDGDCGQWIAPEDDSGVVLVTEGELADLLDMHGWETVTQFPTRQRFHYCPYCRELLCPRCSRFLGYEAHEPCVFCAARAGEPWTGAGVVATTVAATAELALPATVLLGPDGDRGPDGVMIPEDPRIAELLQGPRQSGPKVLQGWAGIALVVGIAWAVIIVVLVVAA